MKLLIQIIAILVVVSTLSICAIKPAMHKTVLVYNSDYKIVSNEEIKTENKEIPVMEMPVAPKAETIKKDVQTSSIPKTQTVVKQTVQSPKPHANVQTVTKVQSQQAVQKPVKTVVKQTVKQPDVKKVEHEVIKQAPKVVQTQTQIAPKVLTQQEEEIAWNVWRSNLQNKIMHDVKLPAIPNGIIFKFSFTVDRNGRVSNVQTYATGSYTPYAIQYIAPVIRSYQGKDILNFPAGSTRITTNVTGGWKISNNERYSTPQDYNDVEKIRR